MDFDTTQDSGDTHQPQQQPPTPPAVNIPDFSNAVYDPYPTKKKGSGWKIFLGIVLVLSILANGFMLLGIIGMGAVLAGSGASTDDGIVEKMLVDGDRTQKIAIVDIKGVINGEMTGYKSSSRWPKMTTMSRH